MRVSAVSDESAKALPALERVWDALNRRGYAVTNDRAIGLPDQFRENFRGSYFNDATLRRDEGDRPSDRRRARDVIRYQWRDGGLKMLEHETITITDRGDMAGKRDHRRVWLLEDSRGEALVRALLALVPHSQRLPDGTFGVNLFRTFTDVATNPHRDLEKFCVFYVLNRMGGGAETYLYQDDATAERARPRTKPVLRHQLDPGEIIIFDDERFKHGATPLEAPPGGAAMRDALICTVDYWATYLGPARRTCSQH
jgi:hypothetical protein